MASIRKYKTGWRAEICHLGTRESKTFEHKIDAQGWALKREREVATLHATGGRSLGEAVDRYIRAVSLHREMRVAEQNWLKAFARFLGDSTPLASIGASQISRWRDARLRQVSASTVVREANSIRRIFSVAVKEWGLIEKNPFTGVQMPQEAEARRQRWGWRSIRRVLRSPRGEGKIAEVQRAFRIALHTGMRLSEILSGSYDARRRVFVLHKTKTTGYVEIPIPRRSIKLFPCTFTVGPNEASALFSKLVRELMLGDLHFHDARASALTWLARRVDVMTLARISRHKDISLLHRVYYRESAEEIARRI